MKHPLTYFAVIRRFCWPGPVLEVAIKFGQIFKRNSPNGPYPIVCTQNNLPVPYLRVTPSPSLLECVVSHAQNLQRM